MIKKIDIPIYFGTLIIIQKKSFKKIPRKYKPKNFDLNGYEAYTDYVDIKNGYRIYLMVFLKPTNSRIIAHEALHIMNKIFDHRNIDYTYKNDEHGAYMLGWIIGECHKYLNINDKNL